MSRSGDLAGVLEAAREAAANSTDLGNRFERLSRAALTAHDGPNGSRRFRQVWGWDDWPGRSRVDGIDVGIDLVAEQTDGSLCAIQCKFYKGIVSTDDVNTFLAACFGREEFTSLVLMHTGTSVQRHGLTKIRQAKNPPCDVFDLDEMGKWDVDWWDIAEQHHVVAPGTPRRSVGGAWAGPKSRKGSRLRRMIGAYWGALRNRFRNARGSSDKPRKWWRRLLAYVYLTLEGMVVTAVWLALAVLYVAGWVLLALLLFALASLWRGGGRKRSR